MEEFYGKLKSLQTTHKNICIRRTDFENCTKTRQLDGKMMNHEPVDVIFVGIVVAEMEMRYDCCMVVPDVNRFVVDTWKAFQKDLYQKSMKI